ncbi:MAG: MarR family transcriptional regulator [Gammaproteobacteria bacterium]|nr:MAG: MarR family transcriptional regulator [Gammaproteobacteria bacterium]RLA14277.1 MAG: MarR family transcriptional regulator [Gammaproteobacteria bacterium]
MTNDCHSLGQIREKMVDHWPEAVTPACDLVTSVARLSDLLLAHSRPTIASHGLTSSEFDVLITLRKMAPPYELTPTALRNSTLITSGGLTKVLHQLEDRQLVERQDDPLDGRIKRVRLTPAGVNTAESTLAEILSADAAMLNQLISNNALQELNSALMKLLAGVEAQVPR